MVLSSLEMELRKSNKVEDIYALPSNLTIEHIMPQTWAEHWAADGVVDADQREAHVHLLGNLTLTSGPLNSSLSNASWEVKRGALATHSLLLLNRDVTRCDTWDEALIDQRVAGGEVAPPSQPETPAEPDAPPAAAEAEVPAAAEAAVESEGE